MRVKEVLITEDHDIVVLLLDGGKKAKIAVLQAGITMDAQVWDQTQWGNFIRNRAEAARRPYLKQYSLEENEK